MEGRGFNDENVVGEQFEAEPTDLNHDCFEPFLYLPKWQSTQAVFEPAVSAIAKFDGFFGGHGRKADDDDGVNGEIIYLQAKHPPHSLLCPSLLCVSPEPGSGGQAMFLGGVGRKREREALSLPPLKPTENCCKLIVAVGCSPLGTDDISPREGGREGRSGEPVAARQEKR